VSHLECFNDCSIPFAPTPDQPTNNGTPNELISTMWRGLSINKGYENGERQLLFTSSMAYLWIVRSKTV
jgi:hypothetical protein